MGIFRFPEIRISKCGNAFGLPLVRPNFLVYPTSLSQANTGDKLFSFLIENMRFLPILKLFFKKQSKKIKKLGSKQHSACDLVDGGHTWNSRFAIMVERLLPQLQVILVKG